MLQQMIEILNRRLQHRKKKTPEKLSTDSIHRREEKKAESSRIQKREKETTKGKEGHMSIRDVSCGP